MISNTFWGSRGLAIAKPLIGYMVFKKEAKRWSEHSKKASASHGVAWQNVPMPSGFAIWRPRQGLWAPLRS